MKFSFAVKVFALISTVAVAEEIRPAAHPTCSAYKDACNSENASQGAAALVRCSSYFSKCLKTGYWESRRGKSGPTARN